MKRMKTLLLALTLFVGGISLASAQSKVAHVDTQELLKTYPEFLSAQASAKTLGDSMKKTDSLQYVDMLKTLQNTAKRFQNEANTQSVAENKNRQKQLKEMEDSLLEFQSRSQYNIEKAQFEKLQPVQLKIRTAIEKVAGTLGYDYVLDRAGLIVAKGKDITSEVKKELGYN